MSDTDLQLLARYTRQHAEDAFTELVRRHLDLVYSAALRQVRSPQLAEEVAQSVFTDLARNARRLSPDTILTAWLYQVTRRTAIDVVRSEARRQLREQIATEMNAMNATTSEWTQIEPLLDDAMAALDETDRAAVLLRYFENKSLREVGQQLGVSDDAAQKRVSRAVERLREFFSKRGVAVGATGLIVVISANAVQAAPVGLAITISAAAAAATITTATIATHTTMHWLNVKSVAAVVAAALTAGTATHLVEQRNGNRLQTDNRRLAAERDKLIAERDATLASVTTDKGELASLQTNHLELLRLRGQVGLLREQVKELERLREVNRQLRAELSKAAQASEQTKTKAEADQQREVAVAKMSAAKQLCLALRMYANDHQDGLPANFSQVAPYLGSAALNMTNQFDLAIQGSLKGMTNNPSTTIAVVGKQPWLFNGKPAKVYGFVDGHAQVLAEPPEGFEAWEKQHMVSPQISR